MNQTAFDLDPEPQQVTTRAESHQEQRNEQEAGVTPPLPTGVLSASDRQSFAGLEHYIAGW